MLRCSLNFNPQSVIRCQQFALWVKMSISNWSCVAYIVLFTLSHIGSDVGQITYGSLDLVCVGM